MTEPAPAPAASPTEDAKAKYGSLGQLVEAIPELKPIFDQAVNEQWTPDRFSMAIQESQWYRTTSAAGRNLIQLQITDPAEYAQQLANKADELTRKATQLGYSAPAENFQNLAREALIGNWSDDQITSNLASRTAELGLQTGARGQLYQQFRQQAADMGQSYSDDVLRGYVQAALDGSQSPDTFKAQMLQNAKTMYPGLTQQLDSGLTLRQIADPYVQQMASILELNPASIDFTKDTSIQKALSGSGAALGADGQPTQQPLWQFQAGLRQDPRWAYTGNARQVTSQALAKIGSDWGFVS